MLFADFEVFIEPMQNIPGKIDLTSLWLCLYHHWTEWTSSKSVTVYRGSDAVDHFITSIVRQKDIQPKNLHIITPMHMTTRDLEEFQKPLINCAKKNG
ncbi:hypothetical protein AVEN_116776-1 [Araneus ventricosus]|uniref:Uncharacterized protein n=1 Tax=Araneus ventricosus TaxID=182803 RepID=A0A4Y2D6K0_ARAVE|nr:hypothetical protein AVEN_116776-1 [Araneus ventricosus]